MGIWDEIEKERQSENGVPMVRVTPETHVMLKELSKITGLSMRKVVGLAIREMAKKVAEEKQ